MNFKKLLAVLGISVFFVFASVSVLCAARHIIADREERQLMENAAEYIAVHQDDSLAKKYFSDDCQHLCISEKDVNTYWESTPQTIKVEIGEEKIGTFVFSHIDDSGYYCYELVE